MGNQTIGTVRNQPFTVFNAQTANATSSIFALFSKPIEPHYIKVTPLFLGTDTGQIDVYLGFLDNTNAIQWGVSEGHSATSGVPVVVSGKPAQFVKVVLSSYAAGGSPAGISVIGLAS